MSSIAWVKGRLISGDELCFGVKERGFLYGDGLFETVRVYQGKPFAWAQHYARLAAGCEKLRIPYSGEEIETGIRMVLDAGKLMDGSLRITLTRGESPRGLLAPPETKPTLVITGQPGEPYPPAAYTRGFRAVIIGFPRNHLSPLVKMKSLSCVENVLGRLEAAAAGVEEGIFLNLKGEVTEGTISNIFLVFGNNLIITPPLESGLLPGITREIIIGLADKLGFSVAEKIVFPQDFKKAQEAFLTNSLLEVMPLISLDGAPIGRGRPGSITAALRGAYQNYILQKLLAGD